MTKESIEQLMEEADTEQQRIYIKTLWELFDVAMPTDMALADQAETLCKFRVAFAVVADLNSHKLQYALEVARGQ